MLDMLATLPYGLGSVTVEIPTKNIKIIKPNNIPKIFSENIAIQKALLNPINSKRLSELVSHRPLVCPFGVSAADAGCEGGKVAIIVSDITRPIPTAKILPVLLEELYKGGVSNKDITIVFALGIHRKQTEKEKKKIVGSEIYNRIKCIDHDINNCIKIGRTKRGTPVDIFKTVAEADIVICTGMIEFHYYAGYTGGAKSILPGVSSRNSIEKNHAMMIDPSCVTGNLNGIVRKDIDEAGTILKIDFILNVILNSNKEIVAAVAGHPIEAHRIGCSYVDKMYKVNVDKADIVITSAGGYPKDINLYQAHKALEFAKTFAKNNGSIILIAECSEGLGNKVYEKWLKEYKKEEIKDKLKSSFEFGGHKAFFLTELAKNFDLYLVSELSEELAKKSYFIPASSAQDALECAINKHGKNASVIVILHCGVINSDVPSAINSKITNDENMEVKR